MSRVLVWLAMVLLSGQVAAQAMPSAHKNIDANGVDRTDGSFNTSLVEGSIGAGDSAMSMVRNFSSGGWTDNWRGTRLHFAGTPSDSRAYVILVDRTEEFFSEGQSYTPFQENGATLVKVGLQWIYRQQNGAAIAFGAPITDQGGTSNICTVKAELATK